MIVAPIYVKCQRKSKSSSIQRGIHQRYSPAIILRTDGAFPIPPEHPNRHNGSPTTEKEKPLVNSQSEIKNQQSQEWQQEDQSAWEHRRRAELVWCLLFFSSWNFGDIKEICEKGEKEYKSDALILATQGQIINRQPKLPPTWPDLAPQRIHRRRRKVSLHDKRG